MNHILAIALFSGLFLSGYAAENPILSTSMPMIWA